MFKLSFSNLIQTLTSLIPMPPFWRATRGPSSSQDRAKWGELELSPKAFAHWHGSNQLVETDWVSLWNEKFAPVLQCQLSTLRCSSRNESCLKLLPVRWITKAKQPIWAHSHPHGDPDGWQDTPSQLASMTPNDGIWVGTLYTVPGWLCGPQTCLFPV